MANQSRAHAIQVTMILPESVNKCAFALQPALVQFFCGHQPFLSFRRDELTDGRGAERADAFIRSKNPPKTHGAMLSGGRKRTHLSRFSRGLLSAPLRVHETNFSRRWDRWSADPGTLPEVKITLVWRSKWTA